MEVEMEETIREKLEGMRGFLQADGGDMDVVSVEGTNVKLRLKGACGGCPHATVTIKQGIERLLREQVDENIVVEQVA
jgi:Fe-S cluster biogenesis protein NfuA